MNIFEIVVLGLVQGLTEFLPVSSSAHLILFPRLLGWQDPGLEVDAILHLGTLVAVLIYFKQDLLDLLKPAQRRLLLAILLATLPAVLVGFGAKDFLGTQILRSTQSVIITLIVGSVIMLIADYRAKRLEQGTHQAKMTTCDLNTYQVFFVGCMQALALLPGISRSGATISASVFMGLKREEAARFAFLLGVPAIAGAALLSCKDLFEAYQSSSGLIDPWFLLLGLVSSFLSGYFAIDFLIRFLKSSSLLPFVIYRLFLALALIWI